MFFYDVSRRLRECQIHRNSDHVVCYNKHPEQIKNNSNYTVRMKWEEFLADHFDFDIPAFVSIPMYFVFPSVEYLLDDFFVRPQYLITKRIISTAELEHQLEFLLYNSRILVIIFLPFWGGKELLHNIL